MGIKLLGSLVVALPWTAIAQAHPAVAHRFESAAPMAGKPAGAPEGRPRSPSGAERLAVDPNHAQTLLLATRLHGLWRSADAGAHWHRMRTFPALPLNNIGLTFVAFDKQSGVPGQPTPVILVGVADPVLNLLRSTDAGKSWKPVAGGPVGMFPDRCTFSPGGAAYLSYRGVGKGALWALNPRTGEWRDITPGKAAGGGK